MRSFSLLLLVALAFFCLLSGVSADCSSNCVDAENKCLLMCTSTACDGQCAQNLMQCNQGCNACASVCSTAYDANIAGCKSTCGADQACLSTCENQVYNTLQACDNACGTTYAAKHFPTIKLA